MGSVVDFVGLEFVLCLPIAGLVPAGLVVADSGER